MLKKSKSGDSGRTFSERNTGYRITGNVSEHGYKAKLTVEIDYAAMTDRKAQKAHKVIYEAFTEILSTAASMRAINVPLFELEDITAPSHKGEGINTR